MDNYLIHFGINGQKWGVRNGPPYPLSSSGRKHFNTGEAKSKSKSKSSIKTTGEPRRKQLTDEQKQKINKALKVGVSTIAVGLAAYGTYKASSNPKVVASVTKGKKILSSEAKEYKQIVKTAASNGYKGFKEGLVEGPSSAGKTLGKVMTGGMAWMAGIEVADLMTNGAATNKILTAYNDYQKKDNRVKTSYRNKSKSEDDD